ncbi:MAG TPA: hypothetical protein VGQ57_03730, partial [Polyangiaceae bacterium]|nr:hypothetical protein [Polyangiaceae bacterium]
MPTKSAFLACFIAAASSACAEPQNHAAGANEAQMPDFPAPSTGPGAASSEVRSVYGEHGYAGKAHVRVSVGGVDPLTSFAVRPDVLRVAFRYQAIGADPNTLHALHAKLDELAAHAASATQKPTTVAIKRIGLEEQLADQVLVRLTAIDGTLEVSLPDSLDAWGRAETLIVVNALIHGVVKELEPANGAVGPAPVQAAFQQAVATVRDPEQYRAELVRRWVE